MKSVFADSYFFIALLNPRDAGHARAVDVLTHRSGKLVTTEWILTEVGDAMAVPLFREKICRAIVDELRADADVVILASGTESFAAGFELFRNRPDKNWPMTDCMSFAEMQRLQIHEALTADSHFRQAGFDAVLA